MKRVHTREDRLLLKILVLGEGEDYCSVYSDSAYCLFLRLFYFQIPPR